MVQNHIHDPRQSRVIRSYRNLHAALLLSSPHSVSCWAGKTVRG